MVYKLAQGPGRNGPVVRGQLLFELGPHWRLGVERQLVLGGYAYIDHGLERDNVPGGMPGGRRAIPKHNPGDEATLLARLVNDNHVAPVNGSIFLSLMERVTTPGPEHRLESLEGVSG